MKTAKGYETGGGTRLNEQFAYGYDAAGNLNQRTNNALAQTFGVNARNELTNVTRSGTLTVAGTTTSAATNVTVNSLTADRYADNTFARTNFSLADGNNSITATAQDSSGRTDTHQVVFNLPATVSFQYDLNGNLISDGKRGFDYDDDNQLIRVTVTNSWKSEFTYDGKFRRRIRKEFAWIGGAWAATTEVRYVYDGTAVIQERDSNNLPQVTYTRTGGRLLSRTDQTTISPAHAFYQSDGNGNITALVSAQQIIVARYHYDPFGNTLSLSGPLALANAYRFSSKELHANSGLYSFLRRYYDPNLQRWINQDPIAERGGFNLYQYTGNNPINGTDSNGLAPTYNSNDPGSWWPRPEGMRGSGFWNGTPGDSRFTFRTDSSYYKVFGSGLDYVKGVPDFGPWQVNPSVNGVPLEGRVPIDMTGNHTVDRGRAIAEMARRSGVPVENVAAAVGDSVFHHFHDGEMVLVPKEINGGIPHSGPASAARAAARAAQVSEGSARAARGLLGVLGALGLLDALFNDPGEIIGGLFGGSLTAAADTWQDHQRRTLSQSTDPFERFRAYKDLEAFGEVFSAEDMAELEALRDLLGICP